MRYQCFFLVVLYTSLAFAQSTYKKDIDDVYLDKLHIKSDSTLATEFQRYAIDLFKQGGTLCDSIFKETDLHRVGICLIYKQRDNVKQDLEITQNTLNYKDLRT